MYPFFEIWSWEFIVLIYSFGLTLTICFFLFLWMLKKLSQRSAINISFFFNRLLWYFLSVVFFSRLFFVISRWNEYKFIKDPFDFFIMSDYNFSLFGAIFWFLLVLITTVRINKLKLWKYIDISVLSFLFVLIFWYIWAFLWWQVYWRETDFGIEILYTNPFSIVPFEVPIFPLAIVYSFTFFILFSVLYMSSVFIKIRWFIWYMWLILFSLIIILLELFSWKTDVFFIMYSYNFTQIAATLLLIGSFIWLFRIYKTSEKKSLLNL